MCLKPFCATDWEKNYVTEVPGYGKSRKAPHLGDKGLPCRQFSNPSAGTLSQMSLLVTTHDGDFPRPLILSLDSSRDMHLCCV